MLNNLKNISDRLNQREAEQDFKLRFIDSELLTPYSKNIYGIRDIDELAEDIKENGLYHNLVVRPVEGGKYEILSGERRYKALLKLGNTKIPCQVREDLEGKDLDAEILLIQANAKARELTHIEKIEQISRLEQLYKQKRSNGEVLEGKTRDIIGKDVGLSGVQVGRYQKIGKKLIGGLKELLDKDKITLTQAEILAAVNTTEQAAMYDQIKSLGKEECKILIEGIKQPIDFPKKKDEAEEFVNDKGVRHEHPKIEKVEEEHSVKVVQSISKNAEEDSEETGIIDSSNHEYCKNEYLNCFWRSIGLCNDELCPCSAYRALDSDEGKKLMDAYELEVQQALKKIESAWGDKFKDYI